MVVPASVAVAKHTGSFVHQEQVFIFVHDTESRFPDFQPCIVFLRLFKKLIIDIKRKHVAGVQPVITFDSLAVAFNSFQPYILLKETVREKRDCFG